jgi:glycosyltransferase involved in cell wall biosynthesis
VSAVLLVSPLPITAQRTGPAIRYWELARVLSADQAVTLLVPNADPPTHPDFAVCACAEADLDGLLAAHRVIVVQGPAIQHHPHLAQVLAAGQHCLVVDLYDPITLEQLEIDRGGPAGRWLNLEYTALLNEQIRLGDLFICANERQRDYWLGALTALGRINQDTYDGTDLRRLIDVVPFGLPNTPPQPGEAVLKGVLPGIAPGDRVILWGGGLWEWLDPFTPIRAMAQVGKAHPEAHLVFFESDRYRPPTAEQAKQLAAQLGLLGRQVLFTHWLPPQQWSACLLEADIGLSFHPASIETHFAFRTRLLDYMWAGLPIVAAGGDQLSELAAASGLGYVSEPGDAEALAKALIALLDEPDARGLRQAAFRQVAEQFRWERVAVPLLRYCREPWHAGDAGKETYRHWHTADRDRLISDVANARFQAAQMVAQLQTVTAERDRAGQRADALQIQLDDTSSRLQRSEAQFQAAMNGRVMRLMTGMQRVWRRWKGGRS